MDEQGSVKSRAGTVGYGSRDEDYLQTDMEPKSCSIANEEGETRKDTA